MSTQDIETIIVERIQAELSPVEVSLRDMTGTRDHWEAVIISTHFEGMRLIARQQRVYKALGELMAGPIHAFTMQTVTPEEAVSKGLQSSVQSEASSAKPQDKLVTLG
jgi:stress-induced morphogen